MSCIFGDCNRPDRHVVGVFLFNPSNRKTIWSPQTNARVCDYHAERGMKMTIHLESIPDRSLEMEVVTTNKKKRVAPIYNRP